MNLDAQHRDYQVMLPKWTLIRDVLSGEDTIKAKGVTYLPKPSGQDTEDYDAYKNRAMFYDATYRTLEGYVGLVFRKKPALNDPGHDLDAFVEDITTTGISLDDFARLVSTEVIATGRAGVLVEYPVVEGPVTQGEIERRNLRPYLTMYPAEAIVDWRESKIRNKKVLSFLKLYEISERPKASDMFETELVQQYRVFYLDAATGACRYELWEKGEKGWDLIPVSDPFVYINDEQIDFIPFVFVNPLATDALAKKPPLLDLSIVNIHHYQVMADRIHAVHWADNPTPVIVGAIVGDHGEEVKTLKLGSATAINLSLGGDAKFLEVQGHGLTPTKELLDDMAGYMAILGSKILSADKSTAEAAETAAIHRAGEHSVLAAMANSVSNALTQCLNLFLKFAGKNGNIAYRLNTDFYPTPMSSQDLIALVGALQAKAISDIEFYEALVAGEIIRPDKTFEEHQGEIEKMPENPVVTASSSGNVFGTMNPPEDGDATQRVEDKE